MILPHQLSHFIHHHLLLPVFRPGNNNQFPYPGKYTENSGCDSYNNACRAVCNLVAPGNQERQYHHRGYSYTISSSTFRFGIRITGLSPSQIPELPPEYTFSPIIELKFLYGDQGIPLELEPYGGGGGGGTNDDGTITISQDFSYKLVSPLPTGQKQHIIALVTLDNIFGIAEPIRFDLEIVPEEGIQG
jgi:hypothetical protein